MKANFECIKENKSYLFCCIILFLSLSLLTFFFDKIAIFFLLNPVHNIFLDKAMMMITTIGTGFLSLAIFVLVCFMKKWRLAWNVLLTFLISGLLVQVLKPIFKAPRPKALIAPETYHCFFEGYTHSGFTSFPSGHATTIFALAAVLAFSATKKHISIAYFFIALLVAYSRIYLGQHFMEDVLAGALLGTFTTLTVVILPKFNHKFLYKRMYHLNNHFTNEYRFYFKKAGRL